MPSTADLPLHSAETCKCFLSCLGCSLSWPSKPCLLFVPNSGPKHTCWSRGKEKKGGGGGVCTWTPTKPQTKPKKPPQHIWLGIRILEKKDSCPSVGTCVLFCLQSKQCEIMEEADLAILYKPSLMHSICNNSLLFRVLLAQQVSWLKTRRNQGWCLYSK